MCKLSIKRIVIHFVIEVSMESYRISIPVYHVGEKKQNCDFCEGKDITESTKAENWAGFGLYFWDSLKNAEYWINSKKDEDREYTIVKANFEIEEEKLLDLTNAASFEDFEYTVNLIKIFDNNIADDPDHFGILINAVFYFLQEAHLIKDYRVKGYFLSKIFYAVKIIGYYPKAEEVDRFSEKGKSHPTVKSKIIYNIRKQTLLTKRIIV